jgi:hypothetical protein
MTGRGTWAVEVSVKAHLKRLLKPTPGSQVLDTVCVPLYHDGPGTRTKNHEMLRKSSHSAPLYYDVQVNSPLVVENALAKETRFVDGH